MSHTYSLSTSVVIHAFPDGSGAGCFNARTDTTIILASPIAKALAELSSDSLTKQELETLFAKFKIDDCSRVISMLKKQGVLVHNQL